MSLIMNPSTEYSFVGNEYFQIQSSSLSSPVSIFSSNNIPTTKAPRLAKPVIVVNGVYDRLIPDGNHDSDQDDTICIDETRHNFHQRYCFQLRNDYHQVMYQYTQCSSLYWIRGMIQNLFREWRRYCFRRRYLFPLIRHGKKKT